MKLSPPGFFQSLLASVFVAVVCLPFSQASAHPLSDEQIQQVAKQIDEAVETLLRRQAVDENPPPAPKLIAASDETLLRRLYIDMAGRLPSEDEVREFISDHTNSTIKRQRLINELSSTADAASWRFQRMADVFRVVDKVGTTSQQPYIHWLQNSMRADVPYDRMISEMLLAQGSIESQPAGGYLLRNQAEPIRIAAEVSRNILGADMTCAACHDHPYADYTQKQFYELASCFNRINVTPSAQGDSAVLVAAPKPLPLPKDYAYRDGNPGEAVSSVLYDLNASELKKTHTLKKDIPQQVTEWVIKDQAERFENVAVLRIWEWMFGHPLNYHTSRILPEAVELPDHLTGKNRGCEGPVKRTLLDDLNKGPLHRPFFATLRSVFRQCGMRMGEFQRVLASTKTYQHEAIEFQTREKPSAYNHFFGAPFVRRLPAEVVWNAMATWSGKGTEVTSQLPQSLPVNHPLLLLGRSDRRWSDENSALVSSSVTRYMINSEATTLTTKSAYWKQGTPQQQIDRVFLSVLGRAPSSHEMQMALQHHAAVSTAFIEDIVWATLDTSEFIFEK